VFIGDGKKTADTQRIKERFEALGIKTDWKRFDRINERRNEVEHVYPRLDEKGLVVRFYLLQYPVLLPPTSHHGHRTRGSGHRLPTVERTCEERAQTEEAHRVGQDRI
jgi:hypothetical protein